MRISLSRCLPLGLALLVGCSDDPAPAADASTTDVSATDIADVTTADAPAIDGGFDCESLGGLCHNVDPGDGPLHDCHEGGHEANPTWCAANAARCFQLCTEAAANPDASAPHDAAHDAAAEDGHVHTDASTSDAGLTPAAVGCSLLGSYCHPVDPGSGPLHDCHEGAHGGDPTWCAANTVSCYTLCREARAAAADAGTADAGAHGGDAATHD
ncbi:MAG: hypothetical protein R3A52_28240 [Polyangiales bacterium]